MIRGRPDWVKMRKRRIIWDAEGIRYRRWGWWRPHGIGPEAAK